MIRVGGAGGFWGESAVGVRPLLDAGVDVLVFDYLAEITLSILARQRRDDPAQGYARDVVPALVKPFARRLAERGVKLVVNAGGVNPAACAAAIRSELAAQGVALKVATVAGDDLADRAAAFHQAGIVDLDDGRAFPAPETVASVNAYLGAVPIAAALGAGADIVVTGRVVDSALTLGPCLWAFGWALDDWDRLAAGSLAGHLIECGPQATGGNFTDWRQAATGDAGAPPDTDPVPGIARIGYPIAEIAADGAVTITKPPGTGGRVSPATVGEQMLYEIGDPTAYALPDVVCDVASVTLTQAGPDRVAVAGARGRPAPGHYKVSATHADGYRAGQVLFFYGDQAAAKARAYGQAMAARARVLAQTLGFAPFDEVAIETFGDESHYGAFARPDAAAAREVALKVAVRHADARAVGLFLRELVGGALATPPGLTMFTGGGRPKPSPVVRLFSFLIPKDQVTATVALDDAPVALPAPPAAGPDAPAGAAPDGPPPPEPPPPPDRREPLVAVPLHRVAWARSGDKGNAANIGVLPRQPALAPYLWAALDEATVAARFAHFLDGPVQRHFLPGTGAINIVLHRVLGGGGVASLRNDPQGKGYAQILLQTPVGVPAPLLESL